MGTMCLGIRTYPPHKGVGFFKSRRHVIYVLHVCIYGLDLCLHFRSKVDHKVDLDKLSVCLVLGQNGQITIKS